MRFAMLKLERRKPGIAVCQVIDVLLDSTAILAILEKKQTSYTHSCLICGGDSTGTSNISMIFEPGTV